MEIDIRGDIIPNDDKPIYDWYDFDSTCPNDIKKAIAAKDDGEMLTILINSHGGSVMAGQEIYSLLHGRDDIKIVVQSLAGSAASVIAMAAKSEISPVAMLMIHNVSMFGASGDYHDMKKNAEILMEMNTALSQAYQKKTGKSQEEILRLMDKETWLSADKAVEMGFIDSVSESVPLFTNNVMGTRLTDEMRQKAIYEIKIKEEGEKLLSNLDFFGI